MLDTLMKGWIWLNVLVSSLLTVTGFYGGDLTLETYLIYLVPLLQTCNLTLIKSLW